MQSGEGVQEAMTHNDRLRAAAEGKILMFENARLLPDQYQFKIGTEATIMYVGDIDATVKWLHEKFPPCECEKEKK